MKVILPTTIDDTVLTTSTIAEPDTGETEWLAGTYNLGDQVILTSTHRVYECVVSSTTDEPTAGAAKTVPSWVDVKPTNRYAMFDNVNSSASLEDIQLIVEIDTGVVNDSVAGFNISGVDDINVTVTDPVDGEVYNTDIDMNDNSRVNDFWAWHFTPIRKKSEFVLTNLPFYNSATIKVTFDGGSVSVGSFIVGGSTFLGTTIMGTGLGLTDYSRYETDDFGNKSVTVGRTSKLVDFDAYVDREDTGYVYSVLSSLVGIPTVWSGLDIVDDPTLAFGYYRDVQENMTSISKTDLTVTVESLT